MDSSQLDPTQQVSIIIPCYKQAHWLGEAIESCLNQTVKPLEIIVVNDGSPDSTSEVAKKYPVKLIEKENGGLSSARNAGIKEAKGYYVLTLDSDDKLHPEFLEHTIGVDDIVGVEQQEFGNSNTLWQPPLRNPKFENFTKHNCINCCSLYKKEIWDKIGGYDENMKIAYEDWDFWLRATKAGYSVTVVSKPLFYYRKHGASMVNEGIKRHEELLKYMLNKHL